MFDPITLPDVDDGMTEVKILGKVQRIDLYAVNRRFLALQEQHADDWDAEAAAINDYIASLGYPRPESSTFANRFKVTVVERLTAEKKSADLAATASASPA